MGIEPTFQAWEAHVLPLNHTRIAPARPACASRKKFYQTTAPPATALPDQTGGASLPMAARNRSPISFNRSGEVILPSSTSLT